MKPTRTVKAKSLATGKIRTFDVYPDYYGYLETGYALIGSQKIMEESVFFSRNEIVNEDGEPVRVPEPEEAVAPKITLDKFIQTFRVPKNIVCTHTVNEHGEIVLFSMYEENFDHKQHMAQLGLEYLDISKETLEFIKSRSKEDIAQMQRLQKIEYHKRELAKLESNI